MWKILCMSLVLLLTTNTFAASFPNTNLNVATDFQGKNACFILYDVTHKKIVEAYNPTRCAERVSPNSTFKVPLSVMAFDQDLITQKTVFKWDGVKRMLPQWNQNQTPRTWLQYSTVWVSQELTPQLGLLTIKKYLKEFHYGNEDFSGNPGKNDGLTQAWLSSSLKISANEQLAFLTRLVNNQLPVSKQAMDNTKDNIYLGKTPEGWSEYGKTGSGHQIAKGQSYQERLFEGFLQKDGQTYIFVMNYTNLQPGNQPPEPTARPLGEKVLTQMGF